MVGTDEILSLYRHDEKAALKMLFDIYYEPLLLYCHKIMHNAKAAEDIVQDCFVHLWFSHRLEHFQGELDGFMFQAVRFRAINYIRDQVRRDRLYKKTSPDEYTLPVIVQDEEAGRETELLYRTINKLPAECRKIFLMACLDDLKYQEIADKLDISINTVKTQMKIALRFLRENLNPNSFSSILLFVYRGGGHVGIQDLL